MAVGFQFASGVLENQDEGSNNTYEIQDTAGSNRLTLAVGLATNNQGSSSISTHSFDSESFTNQYREATADTPDVYLAVGYMLDGIANTGSALDYDLDFADGDLNTGTVILELDGVDQTTPLDTAEIFVGFDENVNGASIPAFTIDYEEGDMIVYICCHGTDETDSAPDDLNGTDAFSSAITSNSTRLVGGAMDTGSCYYAIATTTEVDVDVSVNLSGSANDIGYAICVVKAVVAGDTEIDANVDPLVLTENPAVVSFDVNIAANVDALTLVEFAATIDLGIDVNVAANVDALTLTEFPATISFDVNVLANVDALTLTEFPAVVTFDVSISAVVDPLILTEFPATISVDTNIQANVDPLVLTEFPATISAGGGIIANVDPLVLTEFPAAITFDRTIAANVDALSLATYGATISYDREILANVDALVLTENAATVLFVGGDVNANVDELVLSTYPAAITKGAAAAVAGSGRRHLGDFIS